MTIAVDFDGTIVEHAYPAIGREKPFAVDTLKMLRDEGNRLILWTSREGDLLNEAVAWCHERGLDFYAVNSNQPEDALMQKHSTKVMADVYIDDRNIGGIPDWGEIYMLIGQQREKAHAAARHKHHSHWPFG